jgi:hypothetical protein
MQGVAPQVLAGSSEYQINAPPSISPERVNSAHGSLKT